MFSIEYSLWIFLLATTIALLEIQIEGAHGWAEKLPCWRADPHSFVAKNYRRVMGKKPLTGYHIAIFSLGIIILHFPFSVTSWTLVKELEVLSAFALMTVCEDFLWFIWNPHYGLRKFNAQAISWHKNWIWGIIPTDYLKGVGMSFLFVVATTEVEILRAWGVSLGIFTGLTLLSYLISHLLRKCRV